MKTALEWLEDTLYPYLNKEDKEYTDALFNKAKEMEKEQSQNYAEFTILCDNNNLPILNFHEYMNTELEE